jgi:hypothetical protein
MNKYIQAAEILGTHWRATGRVSLVDKVTIRFGSYGNDPPVRARDLPSYAIDYAKQIFRSINFQKG